MASKRLFDVRLYNIIILGLAFMLIFTAFMTATMAEKSVLDSAKLASEHENGTTKFTGDGYTSLSVIYIAFSVSLWLAPSIIVITGPKWSMFGGSLLYFLFILSFLKPMTWALYTVSGLVGIGASILWTGQGNFLTINSDFETLSRNSGVFWALYESSLLFGNAYSYHVLQGRDTITAVERNKLFIGLSVAALLGSLMLLLLKKQTNNDVNWNTRSQSLVMDSPLEALNRSFHLIQTKEMLLLSVVIAYTGIYGTFISGVYGTCLSNTKHFGDQAKGLIGISGMFIGVGEILGGTLFGLFGNTANRKGRDIIVMFGYVIHMGCFYLIYINLPNKSPIDPTDEAAKIIPNEYAAILCGFLLGLGDSSFNTQIYSLLGFMFLEDSSPAFAIYKFIQRTVVDFTGDDDTDHLHRGLLGATRQQIRHVEETWSMIQNNMIRGALYPQYHINDSVVYKLYLYYVVILSVCTVVINMVIA